MASMGIVEGHPSYQQAPPLPERASGARHVVITNPLLGGEVGQSAGPLATAEVPAVPLPDAAPDAAES